MRINYKSLDDSSTPLIDLSRLSAYREYLHVLIASAQRLLNNKLLSTSIYHNIFSNLLCSKHSVYYRRGRADLLSYIWPNNEPLLIPIWHDNDEYLITRSSSFWYSKYPFFTQIDHSSFYLDNRNFVRQCPKTDCPSILLSDNNHFGHFCYDSLSITSLVSSLPCFNNLSTVSILPFDIKQSIRLSFQFLARLSKSTGLNSYPDFTLNEDFLSFKTHTSSIIYFQDLVQFFQSNTFVSHFIWRNFWLPKINHFSSTSNSINDLARYKKVFLIRTGSFQSRVHNISEITGYLESLGFISLDPVEHSLEDLIHILSNSDVVVSEAGSSLINAGLFTSEHTKIIGLIPRSLLLDPSDNMIAGGLPYFLPFIDRINFVLGQTIYSTAIQSSDIAYYSISDLSTIISTI